MNDVRLCFSSGDQEVCRVKVFSEIIRDGEAERTELECHGKISVSPEKIVVEYDEQQEIETVHNTVTVERAGDTAERITVQRGDSLTLYLVRGEKRTGRYILPFGALDMEYLTEKLDAAFCESGLRIEMVYFMNIGGADSENHIVLKTEKTGTDK